MSAATLAQKIIERSAGRDHAKHEEGVTTRAGHVTRHDSVGPCRGQPFLSDPGVGLWDPSKAVLDPNLKMRIAEARA